MGATVCGPEHCADTRGRASLNMWSAQSGPSPETTQDRIQKKGHTLNPRKEIKIRTRTSELEGKGSIDHATATDEIII